MADESRGVVLRLVRVVRGEDVGCLMPAPSPRRLAEPFYRYDEWQKKRTRKLPLGCTENIEEAKELAAKRRRLDCKNYDGCLDVAARGAWRGFDCHGCGAYQRDEEYLADERAAAMRPRE